MEQMVRREDRYGASELKDGSRKHLGLGLALSVVVHFLIIGFYLSTSKDEVERRRVELAQLPPPRVDTNWSMSISVAKPKETPAGGGSPEVDAPVGPSKKGYKEAAPDPTRNNVGKKDQVIVKNPANPKAVKYPKKQDVAGVLDTSKVAGNVIGTRGQHPEGTGDVDGRGSGGKGIGFGSGDLGGRLWKSRPKPQYPAGASSEGVVELEVTVMPNGAVSKVVALRKPNQALADAAVATAYRWRALPLADNLPQVAQKGKLRFTFKME